MNFRLRAKPAQLPTSNFYLPSALPMPDIAVLSLLLGTLYFRRTERFFADVA
jgi:hypothetical protein